jgi:hypothetical protein
MNPPTISIVILLSVALSLAGFIPTFGGEPVTGDSKPEAAIPVSRLVEKAVSFDGSVVIIEGEIVGDMMKRGSHEWICILDNGTAIGVWADSASVYHEPIIGGYGARGDMVRVTGVFHRACSDHGADLDIHLRTIERLAPGVEMVHPVNTGRAIAAIMFCASGGLFTFLWKRKETGS